MEQHQDKPYWSMQCFSANPIIFTYDYEAMKEERRALNEEAMKWFWHPSRIERWLDKGMDLDDVTTYM